MPRTLLCFPYWYSNPYLTMLTVAPRAANWDVVGGVQTLDHLERRSADLIDGDVLHVHWTSPITKDARDADEAMERVHRFDALLADASGRGVSIVWTVHNMIAHDAAFEDAELAIAECLIARADAIVQLNPGTARATADAYTLPVDKLVTVPHSSYLGVYPDGRDDEGSRRRVGVPVGVPTVGFIGQVRAYKGLEVLCEAVRLAAKEIPDLTFVAAGKVHPDEHEAVLEMLPEDRVVRHFDFVDNVDFADWLRSCDVVALPYRRVLNSGSLLAAATFERICVIPAETPVAETFGEEPWVVTYAERDNEAESLADAIVSAIDRADERRAAAHEFARSYTPYDMSRDYLRLLTSLGNGKNR